MATQAEFYQSHLDRVSRSFAFCIRQLPSPLREWVGLSYLLCRVVDTVEDAPWATLDEQFEAFARFDRALLSVAEIEAVSGWVFRFPAGVSDSEKLLLADAPKLMTHYHRFPPPVHDVMRELIHSMSQGMQHFCRTKSDGSLYLRSLSEVNQYCFFVAGVVGELLTKLLARVEPRFQISQQAILRAHHFGLFLQKVNLLKDQVGDESSGRHLIPSRELVEQSSHENAQNALEFLLALPKEQREFRRFCAWSLFLGLEALNVARRSIAEGRILKVPRQRMEEIVAQVEASLVDDGGLRALFQRLTEHLGWAGQQLANASPVGAPDWLLRLYHGPLEAPTLSQLGI
jgi:phytoene/squalene synthetase